MLKCEVGAEIDCKLEFEGSLEDNVNDVLNLIQGVHSCIERRSPLHAKVFRALLYQGLANPITWSPVERKSE